MTRRKSVKRHNKLLYITIFAIVILGIWIGSDYLFKNKGDNGILSEFTESNNDNTTDSLMVTFDDYIHKTQPNYKRYYTREPIRGLFVNAPAAGTKALNNLIDLADKTEINAFVIDVKDDEGRITYDMNHPLVDEINAEKKYIRNIKGVMDQLYDHNIYPIARIVVFKDPYLSKSKTEYAIKNKDGSLWEYDYVHWLNPYNKETWDYIIDIAKQAAKAGFKEIQFDYIRFEATKKLKHAYLGPDAENKSRTEVITEFVQYAMEELEACDIEVSADVFGTIINSKVDSRTIGQDYLEMAKRLDVICPMVYPSHYGFGFFGIPKGQHSDLYPYETIYGSMMLSNEKYALLENGQKAATVRPWLQAFTAKYLGKPNYKPYGEEEIRAQIQAAYDAGLEEWLLWNAGSSYTTKGLVLVDQQYGV